MPKFTIATDEGNGPDAFDEPLEFADAGAARTDAKLALTEMARERIAGAERMDLAVTIRDETGRQVYRAGLHFEADGDEGTGARPG